MSASATEIRLPLDPGPLRCSAREVATVFAALFREMRAAVPHIRPDERELLRRIMTADGPPAVADLFPAFARNSSEHETLRKLRTAQFIRPAGPDRWDQGAHVEVRPFARLVWDRLGEAAVFGDPPAEESDVDLSLPGAEDSDPSAPPKARWDEDDVLDFLSDPGDRGRNPRNA